MVDGMSLPGYCTEDKCAPSLRGEALRADITGPAVGRVSTTQMNWVSSAYSLKCDQFGFKRTESSALRVGFGHQLKATGDPTTAGGARAQGAGGVNSASWVNPRAGGRADGRLNPEIKVTIKRHRPPRLGGDVVTFEDMFLVACSEYEQQMHITNQDEGDRVLARGRELVDSASLMMVAEEFYPSPTSPRRSLCTGSKGLLTLICSIQVTRNFAARYSVCSRWMSACGR